MEELVKGGYRGDVQQSMYLTSGDAARASRARDELFSVYETGKAAVENQWLSNGLSRIKADTGFSDDPDFAITPEMKEGDDVKYSQDDRSYIYESKSESEYVHRKNRVESDVKRHRILQNAGYKGAAAELIAAVFDPAGWAAGLFTGGLGKIAQVSKTAMALRSGAITAAEAAAFESVLYASDTQRSLDDVTMAAAGGMILGSALSPAIRTSDPRIAKSVDDTDIALVDYVRDANEADIMRAAKVVTETPVTETVTIRRLNNRVVDSKIADHIGELESVATSGLRGKKKGELKAQARALREQAGAIDAKRSRQKSAFAAKFGAPRSKAEEVRNSQRFDMIESLYKPKVDELTREAERLELAVASADKAKKASAELVEFRGKSRNEQIRQLFPDGAPRLSDEIERQVNAAKAVLRQDEPKAGVEDVKPETPDDSAGAARVRGSELSEDYFSLGETADEFVTDLIRSMDDKPDPVTLIARVRGQGKVLTDRLQSSFTTIDHSENLAFRALGHKLLENPQGGVAPEMTASILSDVYAKQIRSKVRNRYNEGFEEWSAENGRGVAKANLDVGRWRDTFDKLVYEKITRPDTPASASITKSADGLRDGFSEALRLRKEAGELGFENVKQDSRYVPHILDGLRINKASVEKGKKSVVASLSKGYQTGGIPLVKESADKLAEIQYVRAMSTTLSTRQAFEKVVSKSEQERFISELEKAGVPKSMIDEFAENKALSEMQDSISNRAKIGFFINPMAEVNGLKVIDLMNYNLSELSDTYFREAAGGAAMARNGFRTPDQALSVIDAAEQYGRNLDISPSRSKVEANILKDSVKLIYGRSIDAESSSNLVAGTRRARELTAIIRLGQLGFTQFTEIARGISEFGLSTVLKNVRSTGFLRRRGVREGSLSSGEIKEPALREIESALYYVGEDNWLRPVNVRHEDFGEGAQSSNLARLYDNFAALGGRVNAIASGFQAVQGGFEKIVMKSIKDKLVSLGSGGKIDEKSALEVGWDSNFIEELRVFFRDNPKTEKYQGREIRLANFDSMSPEMRERVIVGMHRLSGRVIQKNFIGDTSTWMNTWLGKTLTQFRTFSIVSAEKQLVHDLRGDKIKASQILMWSSLLGLISYSTQMQLQALGEPNPDAFLRERMSDRNLAVGVFNKLPQTAVVSLGGDFLASFGALPDDWYAAPSRQGARPLTAGSIAPIIGTAGDAVDLVNSTIGVLKGDVEGAEAAEKARRLIPLGNAIGIGQALKAAIGSE